MKKDKFNEQNEQIKIDEIGTNGFQNYPNNVTRKQTWGKKKVQSFDVVPSFFTAIMGRNLLIQQLNNRSHTADLCGLEKLVYDNSDNL